jgi:hypothetical protein
VHFVFVAKDKDGLGVGVRSVPELKGRPPHFGSSASTRAIASAAMSGHEEDDPAGASPGPAEGPASPAVSASPTAVETPAWSATSPPSTPIVCFPLSREMLSRGA